MRYDLTTAFVLGLLLLPSVPQDTVKGENNAPSAVYSKKFAALSDYSQPSNADAPPKPAVFDSQTLPLKEEIPQEKPIQQDKAEGTIAETKNIPPQKVQVHKHKTDDFFDSLTTAANRSKYWVSNNTRKAANFLNKEKNSAKSPPEQNAYIQGLAAEQRQDVSAAVRLYKAYIRDNKIERSKDGNINADIAAPYYRLAMISWDAKDFTNAENYFREATTYAVGNNRSVVARDFSRFLLERNKTKDAEVILRNILIDEPDNKEFLLPLARCVALQERPIESLRYFTAVFDDDKEKAYAELAAVYRSQNRFDMAQVAERKREEYIAVNTPIVPAASNTTLSAQQVPAKQQREVEVPMPAPLVPESVLPVLPKDDADNISSIAARLNELPVDKLPAVSENKNAEPPQQVIPPPLVPKFVPPVAPLRFIPVASDKEEEPIETPAVSDKPVISFIPPVVNTAEVVKDRSRYIPFTEVSNRNGEVQVSMGAGSKDVLFTEVSKQNGEVQVSMGAGSRYIPFTEVSKRSELKVLPKVQTEDKPAVERSAAVAADYSALSDYSIRLR